MTDRLARQQEVLDESLNMLPDCELRLGAAVRDLREQLDAVTSLGDALADDAVVQRAQEVLGASS